MADVKPSTWLLAGGAVALVVGVFLPWFSVDAAGFNFTASGVASDGGSWFGILALLIALTVGGAVIATEFANVDLPQELLGFRRTQIYLMLSTSALLLTAGYLFSFSNTGFGVLLSFFAAIALVAGAVLADRGPTPSSSATPPTPF